MNDDDLDEIPSEIDFSGGVRGKYAARMAKGYTITMTYDDGRRVQIFPAPQQPLEKEPISDLPQPRE